MRTEPPLWDVHRELDLLRQEWAMLTPLQRVHRVARLQLQDAAEFEALAQIMAVTARLREAETRDVPGDWLDAA